MAQRPFEIPSWAPVAVLAALAIWAGGIWWMVANLDTGGADPALREGVSALHGDMGLLVARLEALEEQVGALHEERAALLGRIEDLESVARVTAVEVAPAVEGADGDEDEDVTAHPLFTDGQDRYNCLHFSSFAEAQEALRVNGPGDPNRIDTNRNGIACEDFRYPAPSTATEAASTPTSAPAGQQTSVQGVTAED